MSETKYVLEQPGTHIIEQWTGKLPDKVVRKAVKHENIYLGAVPVYLAHRLTQQGNEFRRKFTTDTAQVVAYEGDEKNVPQLIVYENPADPLGEILTATLRKTLAFELFTAPTKYSKDEFVRMLRYNKTCISDFDTVLNQTRNFVARVTAEIESNSDQRGNRRTLADKSVKTEVPPQMKVNIQPFVGGEAKSAWVEICLDVSDSGGIVFWLESPELEILARETGSTYLHEVCTAIKDGLSFNIIYANAKLW